MLKKPTSLLLSLLLITQAGCATLHGVTEEDRKWGENRIYIGTRCDVGHIYAGVTLGGGKGDTCGHLYSIFLLPLVLVDLPLSFALDTVLLPYTVSKEAFGLKNGPRNVGRREE